MRALRPVLLLALITACLGDDPAPTTTDGDGGVPEAASADAAGIPFTFTVADATVVRGETLTLHLTVQGGEAGSSYTALVQNTPWVSPAPGVHILPGAPSADLHVETSPAAPFGDQPAEVLVRRDGDGATVKVVAHVFVRGAPGSLDTSFGSNGQLDPLVGAQIVGVFAAADGSLYVQGHDPKGGVAVRPFVVRYDASGKRDAAFGTGGVWTAPSSADAGTAHVVAVSVPPGKDRFAISADGEGALRVLTNVKVPPLTSELPIPYEFTRSRMSKDGHTLASSVVCLTDMNNGKYEDPPFGMASFGGSPHIWPWALKASPADDFLFAEGCPGPSVSVEFGLTARTVRGVSVSAEAFYLLRERSEDGSPTKSFLYVLDASGAIVSVAELKGSASEPTSNGALSRPSPSGEVLASFVTFAHVGCLARVSAAGEVTPLTAGGCTGAGTAKGSLPFFRASGAVAMLTFGPAPAVYQLASKTTTPLVSADDAAISDMDAVDAVTDVFEDAHQRLIVVSGNAPWRVRRFWL